jgi:hypothetical protein
MLKLEIVAFAVVGIIWGVVPGARPFIDVVIWCLLAVMIFTLGARLDVSLRRMGIQPYWRKVRRSKRRRSRFSGASIPLLHK